MYSFDLADTVKMQLLHERAGAQQCVLRMQLPADNRAIGMEFASVRMCTAGRILPVTPLESVRLSLSAAHLLENITRVPKRGA